MDLQQKWKIFQHLDPIFVADLKRVYIVGVTSFDVDNDEVSGDEAVDQEEDSPYSGGVMITRDDDVYFITRNPTFLGFHEATETQELLPFVPMKIEALCGQQIRAISSGDHHVVVLTTDGRIYQWGHMCVEQDEKIILKSQFLENDGIENQKVIQIACGDDHTLALTSEGNAFAWGSNNHGQLGTGRPTYETSPARISGMNGFECKIVLVACSRRNSFALDEDEFVWSWGDIDDCLGYYLERGTPQITPLKIPELANIRKIAAGNTHVLALSEESELFFWGIHKHDFADYFATPSLVDVQNVVAIGASRGSSVSACKTMKGKVYYWGSVNGHWVEDPLPTRFKTVAEVFMSLDSPIMLEPWKCDLSRPIIGRLKLCFDDKETGDVKFKVEGKVMYAHSMILKLRSDHFARMFDHNWKEHNEKQVEVTDFTYQGFRTFLLYLYTDGIDPPLRCVEDAIELFKLADYYDEEDLKRRCEQQLKVLITKSNVYK